MIRASRVGGDRTAPDGGNGENGEMEAVFGLARALQLELAYQVAKLYFELGDYAQCELEAQKVTQKYETSAFVDDALMLKAQAIAMMEGRRPDAQRDLVVQ